MSLWSWSVKIVPRIVSRLINDSPLVAIQQIVGNNHSFVESIDTSSACAHPGGIYLLWELGDRVFVPSLVLTSLKESARGIMWRASRTHEHTSHQKSFGPSNPTSANRCFGFSFIFHFVLKVDLLVVFYILCSTQKTPRNRPLRITEKKNANRTFSYESVLKFFACSLLRSFGCRPRCA